MLCVDREEPKWYPKRAVSDNAKGSTLSSHQTTPLPISRAWKLHVILAILACMWLGVNEYVLHLPFVVTVGVITVLFLGGGIASSRHAKECARHHQRTVEVFEQKLSAAKAETEQLVEKLPLLYATFNVLYPSAGRTRHTMFDMAEWLQWALDASKGELLTWLARCPHVDKKVETSVVKLLVAHIPLGERADAARRVTHRTRVTWAEMTIRRMTPVQPVKDTTPL